MATNKIFASFESADKKSRLDGFSFKSYETEDILLADTYDAVLHDGRASFAVCLAEDTEVVWYFKGGKTNTDTLSAGFNTSWFSSADKDEEIILALTNPPINTDVYGLIITGVTPTNLTANTKLVTYEDTNGEIHIYQVVDPLGTPIFAQITEPKFATIVTTFTTVLDLTNSGARANTLYTNETTGQLFLITQDGFCKEISTGDKDGGIFGTSGEALKEAQRIYSNETEFLRVKIAGIFKKITGVENSIIPLVEKTITVLDNAEQLRLKSQAELKGSVGEITALISLQQSVSQGFTDRQSAITIIQEIYGISEDLANEMIGVPVETEPIIPVTNEL